MKRALIKSLLTSLFITLAGTALNLATYKMYGSLILARTLSGGEWTGRQGFGIMMNHTFPMTVAGDPAAAGQVWLSVDIASFLVPFLILFFVGIILEWRKSVIFRKMREEMEA